MSLAADNAARTRFEQLHNATRHDLLLYLVRRAKDAETAADVLAETYLVAWQKLDRLPPDSEVRPWLFGVARNLLLKDFKRRTMADATVERLAREIARAHHFDQVGDNPQADALRAALAALSQVDREIVTLTAWEGLSPREIAVVLGASANVVRIRLHRARRRLQSTLGAQSRSVTQTELLVSSNG